MALLRTLLSAAIFVCVAGYAADPPSHAGKEASPEWMKLTVPGDNHKALADFVGKWSITVQYWMAPDAKPEASTGKSTFKWIMGGRFLEQTVKSKMGKQAFEGLGLLGYDSVRGEYQSVWLDNMATHMMQAKGQRDPATGTYTENGDFSCAMTGKKNRTFRSELKMPSKKEILHLMWMEGPDGKEFKAMEIAYKRS